jgi:hypothetical protein
MRIAASGSRSREIAVGQRRRAGGRSKVSGDFATAIRAARVICTTFLRLAVELNRERAAVSKRLEVT